MSVFPALGLHPLMVTSKAPPNGELVASRPCANEEEHHDLVRHWVAVVIAKVCCQGACGSASE